MPTAKKSAGQPQFTGRVHLEKGVRPTRIPEENRVLHGMADARSVEVRSIIESIVKKVSKGHRKELEGLVKQLKDSPDYERSRTVVNLLFQLLRENGRLNKRLRKRTDVEENLLFAGLVHTLDPEVFREIGLTEIADIMACQEPTSPSQCLLYGAIEYVKARDREPALVLLLMIQEKDWNTKQQMLLYCFVLDILGLKDGSLSPEEIRAKDIAQACITSASTPLE